MKLFNKNKGFALLIVLGIVVLLSAMSMFYLRMAMSEINRVGRVGDDMRAFYLAEAGREISERLVRNGEWEELNVNHPPPNPDQWRTVTLATGTCEFDPVNRNDKNDFPVNIISRGFADSGAMCVLNSTVTPEQDISSALMGSTTINISGSGIVDAGGNSNTAIQTANTMFVTGDQTVIGQIVEYSQFPAFESVFGMSEAEFIAQATPVDPASIKGNPGSLDGDCYVTGDADIRRAGNTDITYGTNSRILFSGSFACGNTGAVSGDDKFNNAIIWGKDNITIRSRYNLNESPCISETGAIDVLGGGTISYTPGVSSTFNFEWRERGEGQ